MKIFAFLAAVLIFANGCASSHMGSTGGVAGSTKYPPKGITPLEDPDRTFAPHTSRMVATPRTPAGSADRTPPVSSAPANTASGAGDDGMVEIPLYRERLEVGKRVVPKGGIVLRKVVETDTRTIPVELRQEEIVIERVNADEAREYQARGSAPASGSGAFEDREVLIELRREEPVVQKSATVAEVVRARKTIDTRNEIVSGTVRREMIDIDRASAEQSSEPRVDSGATAAASFAGAGPSSVQGRAQGTSNGVADSTREEQDGAELFLHREELQVRKKIVPAGQVTLRKNVTSEEVSRAIELREEDIRVERAPASGEESSTARANAFKPREIFIPLNQEVPTVEKQVELIEVIRAGKRIDTEQQTISGEVRSERVEVAETRAGRTSQGSPNSSAGQGSPAASERGSANAESNQP